MSLAKSLLRDFTVYISGGPGEREAGEGIAAEGGAQTAPPMNLPGLAAFLAGAEMVVGADTGPVHLASALGTPVVAIFGPTSAERNGPLGVSSRLVATDMECSPCMQRKCRKKPSGPAPCVEQVEPSDVLAAVRSLLHAGKGEA